MNNNITVSVIVPTFRREESLKKALESLLNQTIKPDEIIIVDDNGDSCWSGKVDRIVNLFNDESIILIKNEKNIGSSLSRNIGIEASSGEFISFLDDDDVYLTNKIENQVNLMVENDADYSMGNLLLLNENEQIVEFRDKSFLLDLNDNDLFKYHLKYHLTGTDTMMFRRSYLISIGGFDPIDIGDEFYLMAKAIKGGGKFVFNNNCNIKAYIHKGDNGLSSGIKKINGEKALFEYKKNYFTFLDRKDIQYIKMRHHAVLAYAYWRINKIHSFLLEGLLSMLSDPIACIKLLADRFLHGVEV